MTYRSLIYIIVAVTAVALTSCHKAKVKPQSQEMPYPAAGAEVSAQDLYDSMAGAWFGWDDVYVPVTAAIDVPVQEALSGRATMVRDSQIHISLRAMGMEVAVVHADPDSIYLVDKYHHIYIAESLVPLRERYGITLGNLQDLLLGRAVTPGGGLLPHATEPDGSVPGYRISRYGDSLLIVPDSTLTADLPVAWEYVAWASDPAVIRGIGVGTSQYPLAACTYTGVAPTPAGMTASTTSLAALTPRGEVGLTLQWSLPDARWDTGRSETFTPPGGDSRYRRVKLEDLAFK